MASNLSATHFVGDAVKQTEIDGLLSRIEGQIAMFEDNQSALETRIITIVSANAPSENKCVATPVPQTSLGQRLQTMLDRLNELRLRHLDMTQRIEL